MFEAALGRAKRWIVAGVVGLVGLGVQWAHAADSPDFSLGSQATVGGSFSLYMDASPSLTLPADGYFFGSDVILGYDPSVLTLTGFGIGGLFGPAGEAAQSPVDPIIPGLSWVYLILTNPSNEAPIDSGVLRFDFEASALPAGGVTQVLVTGIDDPITGLDGYYAFDGAWINVSVVPEPATVALLLAGLGVVAGSAARQRRALPA